MDNIHRQKNINRPALLRAIAGFGGVLLLLSLFLAATASNTSAQTNNSTDDLAPLATFGPGVTLTPTALSFGSQAVGSSATQILTVKNSGNQSLTVYSVQISGSNAADFSDTNGCTFKVTPGSTCTIKVTFKPSAAGARSATLSISDNATGSPQRVPLSGTGGAPIVTLSPTALSFGSQSVGSSTSKTVTVKNSGNAPLTVSSVQITGTNTSDFADSNGCTASVAAGSSCIITVTFKPSAAGSRTAALSISDNATGSPQQVALSGTGTASAPHVTLSTTSLTFGTLPIGTSASQTVTVTNSGNATLTISSVQITGTNTSDFTDSNGCPASVAAGSSCSITVTFKPSAAGTRTAALSISDNATGSPQQVALSGTGGAPVVTLSPTALSFGSQPVGNSTSQTLTVTNSGNAPLTVSSVQITGANAGDFSDSNGCTSVAAGSSCSIAVTFKPSAAGARSAALSISDNATGSPQQVALSGTGTVSAPGVTLSPTALSYGSQPVGSSTSQTLTVTNSGNAPLTVSSVQITGPNAADFTDSNGCTASVAAGSSCSIAVTFKPSAAGTRSAALSISDNATGSPQQVALSGTGGAPVVTLSPTALSFGSQPVGSGASQTLTVTNSGNAPLAVSSVQITGTNAGDFTDSNGCTASVAAGSSCTIAVTFSPSAAGTRSAMLSIGDNATGSPQQVTLSGTGVAKGGGWTVSPTILTFPSQTVQSYSATSQIAVSVTSASGVSLTATLSGANAADFFVPPNANNCIAFVGPATCGVGVGFHPTAAGTRTATLTLSDGSGNSVAVALSGTATTAGSYISGITLYAPTSGQIFNSPGQIQSPINCQETPTATAYAPTNAVPVGAYCATVNVSGLDVTNATVSITGVTHPGASSNVIKAAVLATTATSIIYASAEPVAADGTTATVSVTANGVTISQAINVGTPNMLASYNAAARLLEQAAFGPSHDDIVRVQQLGINGWINNQFNAAPVDLYVYNDTWGTTAPWGEGVPAKFLIRAVDNPGQTPTYGGDNNDQLRQRVAFALSQLFVISANDMGEGYGTTFPHENMLYNDAFSSYTQLLTDVTLSPPMGAFLDMAGSKSQASSGYPPNQNYGREVLQLFSIGTNWLDMSGNPIAPPAGYSTTPYGQNEIINFANLFTGWNSTGATVDPKYCDSASAVNPGPGVCSSMLVNPYYHDWTAKTLLAYPSGGSGPNSACPTYNQISANTNAATQTAQAADNELTCAIANIANHPNVPPFISKFLIQHLVTSNPSPGYVNRVATTFKNSNGDMKATLSAILTDAEARDGDTNLDYQNPNDSYLKSSGVDLTGFGHLKEPLLAFASYYRAIGGQAPSGNFLAMWDGLAEGQESYAPPSVFNFYSPFFALSLGSLGISPPVTASGVVFAPEFQIFTAATAYERLTDNYNDIMDFCCGVEIVGLNYSYSGTQDFGLFVSAALADWPQGAPLPNSFDTLLDALDAAFMHGHMDLPDASNNTLRAEMTQQILNYAPSFAYSHYVTLDPINLSKIAVYLANQSPYNQVAH